MDDVKRYLREVAKYSFWIVCGLVLILASVVFYLTKSDLDESINSRSSAVKSAFQNIATVSSKAATHPNEFSHQAMDQRLTSLKADVEQAWRFQYERQKEFLTWPTEAFYEMRTHEIFDSLRPFEKKVPFPLPAKVPSPLDSITENDRKVYRQFIEPEFPKLASKIGSSWKYKLGTGTDAGTYGPPMGGFGSSTYGASAAPAVNNRDIVRWAEDSQKQLAGSVLPWFSSPVPPTIHQIYYAQEDIWILRGLMDIIAQTNSGARENFQAIVKEIEWIRMGSQASRDAGSLIGGGGNTPGGSGPGGGYGSSGPPSGYTGGSTSGGMPSGYNMGGRGGSSAAAARSAAVVDPAEGRYVDANFKPLTGTALRSAMNLQNATDAVNAVAKRIPVRMRLKVDDRFGKLITECGNGKMMLEVIQVRYNTDPAESGGSGGGYGGAGMAGGRPTIGGGASGPTLGGGSASTSVGDEGPSGPGFGAGTAGVEQSKGEIPIEVFGIIYLFNPPENLSNTKADPTQPVEASPPAPATLAAPAPASTAAPADSVAPPDPNAAPPVDSAAPPVESAAPPVDSATPPTNEATTSPSTGTTPPPDGTTPPTEGTSPPGGG